MQKRTVGLVAASIAALVLLGGTAADAGGLITGKDVKDGSLTVKDFKASERAKLRGPAGPTGPAGLPGAVGPAGAPGVVTPTIVQSPESTIPAGEIGTVIAFCPAGKKVSGGGYAASIAIAAANIPNNLGNAWGAVINNSDNVIPIQASAYAICV